MLSQARREGFSLIGVLIVSLCGMLIMAGVMGMHEMFSGGSRRSMTADEVYNVLEREVERAKGSLKMAMILRKKALRYDYTDPPITIAGMEGLLVKIPAGEPGAGSVFYDFTDSVKVGGKSGTIRVAIYDMQYKANDLDAIPNAERHKMPLAVTAINSVGVPGNPDAPVDPGEMEPGGPGGPGDPGPGTTPDSVGVYLIRASLTMAADVEHRIDVAVTQNANPTL